MVVVVVVVVGGGGRGITFKDTEFTGSNAYKKKKSKRLFFAKSCSPHQLFLKISRETEEGVV
jgi:hypothetical protein